MNKYEAFTGFHDKKKIKEPQISTLVSFLGEGKKKEKRMETICFKNSLNSHYHLFIQWLQSSARTQKAGVQFTLPSQRPEPRQAGYSIAQGNILLGNTQCFAFFFPVDVVLLYIEYLNIHQARENNFISWCLGPAVERQDIILMNISIL